MKEDEDEDLLEEDWEMEESDLDDEDLDDALYHEEEKKECCWQQAPMAPTTSLPGVTSDPPEQPVLRNQVGTIRGILWTGREGCSSSRQAILSF